MKFSYLEHDHSLGKKRTDIVNEFKDSILNNVQLTVIVPVFQEASIIKDSLDQLYRILNNSNYDYEVIVADDGSTDHCDRIIYSVKDELHNLKFMRHPLNMGRGFILTKAIRQSRGNVIIYIDADLQVDPEVIPRLAQRIEDGFDIAIGSKHHPDSQLYYSRWRKIQSLAYNKLARRILNVNVNDFQCGAKAFKRTSILELLRHLTCNGWSWDTELIFKAKVLGYMLAEIPVIVRPNPDRKSSVDAKCIFNMGQYLIHLWIWSRTEAGAFAKTNKPSWR